MDPKLWQTAAAAAAARAGECRRRADRLSAGLGSSMTDVDTARQRLVEAQMRAVLADESVKRAVLRLKAATERVGTTVIAPIPTSGELAQLRGRIARSGVHFDSLWLHYASLAGCCSSLELEAALHGALTLPPIEYTVIHQVVWEIEHFS